MYYYIKKYTNNYYRFYSINKHYYRTSLIKKNSNSIEASLSRTKRNIKDIAFANDFEYFVTLTINSGLCNRYILEECQNHLKKILKYYKRKNNNFIYLLITEKHKDGAFHFHGLMGGINKADITINNNGYYDFKIFTEKMGFCSISKIRSKEKCYNYIMKYITKDCIRNEHNQIYISSRGLKKVNSYEYNTFNKNYFYNHFGSFNQIHEHCYVKDIYFNKLSKYNQKNFLTFLKNSDIKKSIITQGKS